MSVRRTTNFSIPNGSYGDVTWDTTDFENESSVLEHDSVNTDRIQVKADGVYLVAFSLSIDFDAGEEVIDARVRIDDSTVIPQSVRQISEDDETNAVSNIVPVSLSSGEYLTLQLQANGDGNVMIPESTFMVARLEGVVGATGPTGPSGGLTKTGFTEITSDTTTTSTTFTDLLSLAYTKASAGSDLDIFVSVCGSIDNNDRFMRFQLVIDGSAKRGFGLQGKNAEGNTGALVYKATGLASGSRTIKVQWLVESDTGSIRPVTVAYEHCSILVHEVDV